MALAAYWRVLAKRLWLIVLMMVVAGGSAFYYARQQVPLYSTSTTLYLNSGIPNLTYAVQSVRTVESLAETYIAFMGTQRFGELVAARLDTPLPAGQILGALRAEWVQQTQFFKIGATHPDPATAQALANTAAAVFIAENISRQQEQQQQIAAQQEPVTAMRLQQLLTLQTSLQAELELADDRLRTLEAQVAELEAMPASEENDQKILRSRSDLTQQQSMRASLFASLVQIEGSLLNAGVVTGGIVAETAVVVDPAPLPEAPMSRGTVRSVLLATAAAALLGVGLAFLLEYLDWTIRTPEELDAVYGSGTLGVVGVIRGAGGRSGAARELVSMAQPHSPDAEAYRSLRTNLRFSNPGHLARSLLVTSAAPLEGKTTTACNLAVVLAQAGSRVILVDADLRRPGVHRAFKMANRAGLSDLIVDPSGDVEARLQATGQPNLWVLPTGPLPRNPAELLGSERCAQVMEALKEHADVVVYDSPPAGTVTDAAVLASRVDGVLQVVRAGVTRRDLVVRVRGLVEKVGGHVIGPVLNMVRSPDMGTYQYYYSHYYRDGTERRHRAHAGGAAPAAVVAGGVAAVEVGPEVAAPPAEAAAAPPASGTAAEAAQPARPEGRRRAPAGRWRPAAWAAAPWLVASLGWAAGLAAGAALCYQLALGLAGVPSLGPLVPFLTSALLGLVVGAVGGLSIALALRLAGCPPSRRSLRGLVLGWVGVWTAGQLVLTFVLRYVGLGAYGWLAWVVYGAALGLAGGALTGLALKRDEPAARPVELAAGWAGALAVSGALAFILRLSGYPNPLANPAAAGAPGAVGLLAAAAVGAAGGAIGAAVTLGEIHRARGGV